MVFFFVKQKTAYEMRISDWSSDVCSSDLSSRNRLHFLPRCRSLLRKQGRRVMVNMVLRGAVLLWAAFFAIVGARGLLDPASYTETFGFTISGVAIKDRKSVV